MILGLHAGGPRTTWFLLIKGGFVFVGFQELVSRVEANLEEISSPQRQRKRKRVYGMRKRLRRDMIGDNPIYQLFVSGSSTGCDKHFFCMICHRDVSMESRGALEFSRHFFGKQHWQLDVTYRVQNNLPVFNRLMDPMELTDAQLEDYRNRPCKGKAEGFSFPEDLLPACPQVESSVPLLTVNCLLELLRSGGSNTLLRKLWGCFRATLGPENPLYSLKWSREESFVSILYALSCFCRGVYRSCIVVLKQILVFE